MERLLAISFVFMCMCCLCPLANAGTFAGTPEVKVLTPTDTRMAVCTPNEKYLLERGTTTEFRLYIRNDMSDKDVKRVYLYIAADDGFNFSVYPSYLEDVMAEEYKYFDINVTSKPDMPSGNYKVAFLVGTDEYGIGAFEDVVMIKIRDYGTEVHYFLGIGVVLIAILLVTRFIWIWTVNKKAGQQHSRPSLKKSKAVSEYYYKNRSLDNRSDKKKSQDKRREEKKPSEDGPIKSVMQILDAYLNLDLKMVFPANFTLRQSSSGHFLRHSKHMTQLLLFTTLRSFTW